MKKLMIIMLLTALQCACAAAPATSSQSALLSFDELAREINVARVEQSRPAGRSNPGPLGTP